MRVRVLLCGARQKKAVEDLMLKEIELEEVHRVLKVPLSTQGYRVGT